MSGRRLWRLLCLLGAAIWWEVAGMYSAVWWQGLLASVVATGFSMPIAYWLGTDAP